MEPLLDAKELARILNVRQSSIYRWAAEGKIPTLRVGALLRFQLPDVIRVMGEGNGGDSTAAPDNV
ncbi:MAG: helix-turn-helix domain-containing protein [Actinobacteria bacterium]|nr:helix-turn-helix domain-containing protein [Actinomycetota bacterium]